MTQPSYTRNQATTLAALIAELNPAWDHAGVMAALTRHALDPHPFADLAVAAVNAATHPDNQVRSRENTPERIWFGGPHWPTRRDTHDRPTGLRCPDHDTFEAANCPACLGDVLAGDRPRHLVGKHHTPEPRHDEAPPVCEDHGTAPAGECPTCWAEVNAGTRARRLIGRAARQT